jgi:hypothetical protein
MTTTSQPSAKRQTLRQCGTCHERKPLEAFYWIPYGKDLKGRSYMFTCQVCQPLEHELPMARPLLPANSRPLPWSLQPETEAVEHPPAKRCGQCKGIQPRAKFSKSSRARDGLQANCKACDSMRLARFPKPGEAFPEPSDPLPTPATLAGKVCHGCGEYRERAGFSLCTGRADLMQPRCKACESRRHAADHDAATIRFEAVPVLDAPPPADKWGAPRPKPPRQARKRVCRVCNENKPMSDYRRHVLRGAGRILKCEACCERPYLESDTTAPY